MRIIRCLFKSIVLLVLFVLGVLFADKAILSRGIIGVHISSDTPTRYLEQVSELVNSGKATNAEQLCLVMNDYGISECAVTGVAYFEQTTVDGVMIPSGIYQTVFISDGDNDSQYRFLFISDGYDIKQTEIDWLNQAYVIFLSALGFLEKTIKNMFNVL